MNSRFTQFFQTKGICNSEWKSPDFFIKFIAAHRALKNGLARIIRFADPCDWEDQDAVMSEYVDPTRLITIVLTGKGGWSRRTVEVAHEVLRTLPDAFVARLDAWREAPPSELMIFPDGNVIGADGSDPEFLKKCGFSLE